MLIKDSFFVAQNGNEHIPQPDQKQPSPQFDALSAHLVVRSKHFIFGTPRPIDARYDIGHSPLQNAAPGISLLVREGFVVGHSDKLRVPIFVCMRWTQKELEVTKHCEKAPDRQFQEDDELPLNARANPKAYKGSAYDRGHMARNLDNLAWGEDNCEVGNLMSNIAPQREKLNRKVWLALEEAHHRIVGDAQANISAIWIIAGTVFDNGNASEFLDGRVGVPIATYKILAWFDGENHFRAVAYLFPQEATDSDLLKYITSVDQIETKIGIDFFPELDDATEAILEAKQPSSMWE